MPSTEHRSDSEARKHPSPEGMRITKLRERLGLTRAQFAFTLGTSENTIWRWETGLSKPEAATAALLNAIEQQLLQTQPKKKDLLEAVGKVGFCAVAGGALLALLSALFSGMGKVRR